MFHVLHAQYLLRPMLHVHEPVLFVHERLGIREGDLIKPHVLGSWQTPDRGAAGDQLQGILVALQELAEEALDAIMRETVVFKKHEGGEARPTRHDRPLLALENALAPSPQLPQVKHHSS